VFTKFLVTPALALTAALGIATPAGADPSAFGVLSCACEGVATAAHGAPNGRDQVNNGIENGLADLQGVHDLPAVPGPPR
jgi:hypothetical protein